MLTSYSQAGQDLFVVEMLQGKTNGTFLELGASDPVYGSNTYLLEHDFSFTGTSIDLVDVTLEDSRKNHAIERWKQFYKDIRADDWPESSQHFTDLPGHIQKILPNRNPFNPDVYLHSTSWKSLRPLTSFNLVDAFEFDYSKLPARIDYASIDIDPPLANLQILEKFINKTRFNVITFEHDIWRGTDEVKTVRDKSRKLFRELGYTLVVSDATLNNRDPFEDWYVDSTV